MLLSLRGWGADEFARAEPEFMAGARAALFVERLVPVLKDYQALLAAPLPNGPAKLEVASRKMTAQKRLPELRRVLGLDDDA